MKDNLVVGRINDLTASDQKTGISRNLKENLVVASEPDLDLFDDLMGRLAGLSAQGNITDLQVDMLFQEFLVKKEQRRKPAEPVDYPMQDASGELPGKPNGGFDPAA